MIVRVIVTLSPAAREALARQIVGQGGWQDLLRKLRGQVTAEGLVMTVDDVERTVRCAREYGTGGFQDRLEAILGAFDELRQALR